MPAALMMHDTDPKKLLMDKIGSVEDHDVFHNQLLVAVYVAPQQMASGLWRPDKNVDEDKYQGKIGLILKMGPTACQSDDKWVWPDDMKPGDWIVYRTSDGFPVTLNGNRENLCRMLDDVNIRMRIQHPDQVW